ncbi:MAG: protein kinase domain-containing protein [Gemmata sp.]
MGTPTDPTGSPSSVHSAVPVPSSGAPEPAPERTGGSTDLHRPAASLSDLMRSGNAARRRNSESDIAQFLAHPRGGAANTDDAPTVITQNPNKPRPPAPTPPPAGDAPSITGRCLGHYELIEAIGAGGMAAVLKARDLELGRIVALKILPQEAARDPESVTRFKQEARSAAKLDHENIARVYSCGEDQGLHFIAFEFVEGDDLRVVIDRRGPLPAAECVGYMMQVAAGLNHAAERGVVHRDIKPSNILITPDGRAKIVDMGLARYLGSEVNGGVTQSGVTLGTFDYISPEQALDPRRADVRSDVYSLGCTFYHALTGRPPVPEGTAARKLRAHQEDDFLDPRVLNPAVPDELAAVLARMMMKDPAARYQTPTELIAHLKGLAERLQVGDALSHDSAVRAVPADPRVLPEPPSLRPWALLAAVAVALAVVAFVVATGDPGRAPGLPGVTDAPRDKDGPRGDLVKGAPALPAHAVAGDAPVRSADELAKRLEDPATTKVVLAPGRFDLTKLPQGLASAGAKLELVGAGPGLTRVVVTARAQRGPGALTLKASEGTVAVRGVWFDLREDGADGAAPDQPVGLRIEDATGVELTDCVFAPSEGLRSNHEPRAVLVARALEGAAPPVEVTRCLFAPGAVALAVPAGAAVAARDTGFAAYGAAVQFDAPVPDSAPRGEVRLDHCSFMLDAGGAAVEVGSPGGVLVRAADCVFAPASGARNQFRAPADPAGPRVVIRVREEKLDGVQFAVPERRTNAFYRVEPVGTPAGARTFGECRTIPGLAVEDKGRAELKQRPWEAPDPFAAASVTGGDGPWRAFRLHLKDEPALFTADKERTPAPLGVAFHDKDDRRGVGLRRAYPDLPSWPPPRPVAVADLKEKTWYPKAPAGELPPGTDRSLKELLKVVRPDDVILIKHPGPGELKVDGEELRVAGRVGEAPDLRVTFRPAPGSNPVLAIEGDDDIDQTLFKMKGGEVTFEGLQFRLKPKGEQTVAAVAVLGGKSCTFKSCVFTLAEEDGSKAAAVHLPDLKPLMAMDPAAQATPKVAFEHCVIRGKGRGVWVVTRPVDVKLTDTLTALDGPLLLSEAGGRSGAGGASAAKLTRVTALAGGPLVAMRGGKATEAMRASGLTKLDVEADECLFVAVPSAGARLLDLEGVEPSDWKSVLGWQVKKANRYANFDAGALVAQIRPADDGTAREWNWDDWTDNVGEPPAAGKRLGKVTFAAPPAGLRELAAVRPADLAVKAAEFPDLMGAKVPDAGARIDPKELPLPPDESRPE